MMRMRMATYSLVHGAWHGGWAWDLVRAELESRGHVVHTPDLPCEDVGATLDDYAACVPPADILVGHSLGGLTIAQLPAQAHVYLCALLPGVTTEFVPGFGASRVRDELGRSYYPDWRDGARELQYPPEHAELAKRLRRQAPMSAERPTPDARATYVVCANDACISPAWQRETAQRFRTVVLEAGHSPMLTHARELAELLDDTLRVQ
jgi:pimeloyl-ACP methyl ester carboxylesterase